MLQLSQVPFWNHPQGQTRPESALNSCGCLLCLLHLVRPKGRTRMIAGCCSKRSDVHADTECPDFGLHHFFGEKWNLKAATSNANIDHTDLRSKHIVTQLTSLAPTMDHCHPLQPSVPVSPFAVRPLLAAPLFVGTSLGSPWRPLSAPASLEPPGTVPMGFLKP